MQIEKLFRVLVLGGAALGMTAAGCGYESDTTETDDNSQQVQRLPDGGVADAGTKPTTNTGGNTGGGGVSGW